jgi:hypothetical protein
MTTPFTEIPLPIKKGDRLYVASVKADPLIEDSELSDLTDEFRELLTAGRNGKPYDRARMREVSTLLRKKLDTPAAL